MAPVLPKFEDFETCLRAIDLNGIYTNYGPLVRKFEAELASHFALTPANVVTVTNATLAIQGAIQTSPDYLTGRWIVPSWTFAATPLAALQSGVDIFFGDVDINGYLRSEYCDEKHIEVLPFGAPPRFLNSNTTRIIDAAASFDALQGLGLKEQSGAGYIVSLHATKLLPAGEGAVFVSKDSDWVTRVRNWANFGFESGRNAISIGTNAKMSEYSAAVGLASYSSWAVDREDWIKKNSIGAEITSMHKFDAQFSLMNGIATSYWILYSLDPDAIKRIVDISAREGIQTRTWWNAGCHLMPYFCDVSRDLLANTSWHANHSIGLPMHRKLDFLDFEKISEMLRRCTS